VSQYSSISGEQSAQDQVSVLSMSLQFVEGKSTLGVDQNPLWTQIFVLEALWLKDVLAVDKLVDDESEETTSSWVNVELEVDNSEVGSTWESIVTVLEQSWNFEVLGLSFDIFDQFSSLDIGFQPSSHNDTRLRLLSDFVQVPELIGEEVAFQEQSLLSSDGPWLHSEQEIANFLHTESLIVPLNNSISHNESKSFECEKQMVWWVQQTENCSNFFNEELLLEVLDFELDILHFPLESNAVLSSVKFEFFWENAENAIAEQAQSFSYSLRAIEGNVLVDVLDGDFDVGAVNAVYISEEQVVQEIVELDQYFGC
jgi:hypothetical protein